MIRLYYLSNTYRATVTEVESLDFIKTENLKEQILELFQKFGYEKANDPEKLYIIEDKKFIRFDNNKQLEEDSVIRYSTIVFPQNAVEVGYEDGIKYIIHANEDNHRNDPHIHAQAQQENLRISLGDYTTKGNMKSSLKRKAIKYVKEHHDELEKHWEDIVVKKETRDGKTHCR